MEYEIEIGKKIIIDSTKANKDCTQNAVPFSLAVNFNVWLSLITPFRYANIEHYVQRFNEKTLEMNVSISAIQNGLRKLKTDADYVNHLVLRMDSIFNHFNYGDKYFMFSW